MGEPAKGRRRVSLLPVSGAGRLRVVAVASLLLAGAATAGLVLAGGDGDVDVPTDAEARAFLDRLVAAAMADDFDRLCALSGIEFNCQKLLSYTEPGSRPPEPPTVVASNIDRPEFDDGVPGRLLVVEGTDGLGKPYRTEVLILRDEDHFDATNAVYWGNFEIYDRQRTEERLREREESIPDGERRR